MANCKNANAGVTTPTPEAVPTVGARRPQTVVEKLELAWCIVDAGDAAASEMAGEMSPLADKDGMLWTLSYALQYAASLIRDASDTVHEDSKS